MGTAWAWHGHGILCVNRPLKFKLLITWMHVVGFTTEYLLPYIAVYERCGGGSDRSASPAFLLQKYNQRASRNVYFDDIKCSLQTYLAKYHFAIYIV